MSAGDALDAPPPPMLDRARGDCAACGRPYGRRRAPRGVPEGSADGALALLECAELVVCDQCWYFQGRASLDAEVVDVDGADAIALQWTFPPQVSAALAAVDRYDALHPLDRRLVESGVRWSVLRHVALPARMKLAGEVLCSVAPPATRPADSPLVWCDAVEARMRAQTTSRGKGGGKRRFVYRCRKQRWWQVVQQLALAAHEERRPLTWISQLEIATLVGCDKRTVRRVVKWLREEGLLWEVVKGTRVPLQRIPDDETPAEAAERAAQLLAEITAAQAQRTRARAEIDAARGGHRGTAAVKAAQLTLSGLDGADLDPAALPTQGQALADIAPVYELRLPDEEARAIADRIVGDALAASGEHAPISLAPQVTATTAEFVHPPLVSQQGEKTSSPVQNLPQPVDKGRAPRGPQNEGPGQPINDPARVSTYRLQKAQSAGSLDSRTTARARWARRPPGRTGTPQSRSVNAARRLLRSLLQERLCTGVAERWLAAEIRASRLITDHDWTDQDLADHLHGEPERPRLPYEIRSPRAWIRARLRRADPDRPPSTMRRTADARRAALACHRCDDDGYLQLPGLPEAVCSHEGEQGW